MKPIAIGERIIAKRIDEVETEKDGIFIPETVQEKPQVAKIVGVGPGRINPLDGSIIALSLKEGDSILLPQFGITEVKIDDVEYVICKEDDVLCKLAEKKG